MNSYIKNPKILLLKCSIEYLYREETKFTCIEPIVLQVSICLLQFLFIFLLYFPRSTEAISLFQEREFLKNYVQRIVDVRPNLVLVEKTVSRIAQDMLLEHGITLVINVKPVSYAFMRSYRYPSYYLFGCVCLFSALRRAWSLLVMTQSVCGLPW